jgi:hypothetical protein
MQIIVQKYVTKSLSVTLDFSVASLMFMKYQIILLLKYFKVGCVYIVYGIYIFCSHPVTVSVVV